MHETGWQAVVLSSHLHGLPIAFALPPPPPTSNQARLDQAVVEAERRVEEQHREANAAALQQQQQRLQSTRAASAERAQQQRRSSLQLLAQDHKAWLREDATVLEGEHEACCLRARQPRAAWWRAGRARVGP